MGDEIYQIEIKSLEKDAVPDKEYEASDCVTCELQIRKIGQRNFKMNILENIARASFILDTTKKHTVILHYKKE